MTTAGLLILCLLLGVAAPLVSFVFLALFGARLPRVPVREGWAGTSPAESHDEHEHPGGPAPGEPLAGWIATAAVGLSLLLSLIVLLVWSGTPPDARAGLSRQALEAAWTWVELGRMPVSVGVRLDSLTVIMFLMVTLCATCIHVFSLGYMRGEPGFARFFAFLSLFCFSMLGLVVCQNLLLMFVFWELVGICSYLLIGFWFERRSASDAAIKAFVVNRVGDFGFLVGLGLCVAYLGTLSLDAAPTVFEAGARQAHWLAGSGASPVTVSEQTARRAGELFTTAFFGVSLATWMGLGLFCGAVGKSAQFPLHVWLPDAMEGPTPVSALIHAATMVAAGVYLVARIFALLTPAAQFVIACVGCITLTMAALMAIVQTDIKRVLAYSTLSQLGYMIFGLGVGAWIGALFHLLTHAFFKALLFLGAGQVIAGCHHEQDLRRMGGLASKMPRTAVTFLIAVLAISGAGIPWTPLGVGGFYSKDEILAVAQFRAWGAGGHALEQHGAAAAGGAALPAVLWLVPLAVAYITPFYMGRCFVLAFLGQPRDRRVYEHARESPIMYGPLIALAGLTIVSGPLLFRQFVSHAAPRDAGLVAAIDGHDPALHAVHAWLPLEVGLAWVLGLGLAYAIYRDGLARAEGLARLPILRQAQAVLVRKFYFDDVYNGVLVGATKLLAIASRLFDNWIIDGLVDKLAYLTERISRFCGVVLDNGGVDGLVNGVGQLSRMVGASLRQAHTGIVRNYVLLTALGMAALVLALWNPYVGVGVAAIGAAALARNYTAVVVLTIAIAVAGGWSENPPAAAALLAAGVLGVMLLPLWRRRLALEES